MTQGGRQEEGTEHEQSKERATIQRQTGAMSHSMRGRRTQALATIQASSTSAASPGDIHVDGPLVARLGALRGAAEQNALQPGGRVRGGGWQQGGDVAGALAGVEQRGPKSKELPSTCFQAVCFAHVVLACTRKQALWQPSLHTWTAGAR